MDYTELKEKIRGALRGVSGVSVDENGFYYTECDKDYRNELSDEQVADILAGRFRFRVDGKERFEEMEPRNVLYNILTEGYQEEMWRIEDEVLGEVKKNADVASFVEEHGIDDETLENCLRDVWYVTVPVDDYLKQDVCMDIMLDTGDMNFGFCCNDLLSSDIESADDFDDNSSLLWLCEQQGVTREELFAAIDKGTAHSGEVVALRERKAELVAELQQFGFVLPKFTERVWHTGAYQEYTRLQAQLTKLTKEMQTLSDKRVQNSLSYQDYLKQHFDRFERLDPMSEEQFNARKAEILERLSSQEEAACAEYARVKDQLDFKTDYRRISLLQREYKDVAGKLKELSETEEYKKAEFIDSVYSEVNNMTYSLGVVTFLVKMPLEEAIRLGEVIDGEKSLNSSYSYDDRTGCSSFVLGKDVRCGLLDITNGAGSTFDIALHKDVEIPVKAIYRAVPDEELGEYGFMSIYGTNDEFYEESLKEICDVVPEKVDDLIAAAEDKCEGTSKNVHAKDYIEHEKG